jgi:hypothetical protein
MKRNKAKGLVYFGNQGYSNFFEGMNSDGDGGITKKALVAVEGTFDDSQGNSHTFSPERLHTIADHTNAALEMGNVIPVCQDHNKTVDSTVGTVDGNAYVKAIEVSDLPNSKSTHLLGKLGLFLEDVHIKTSNAVSKVRDGVVTSVSMGLNLDPKEHRIMELSLVPIPAIPNMGLFRHKSASFGLSEDIDSQAFTWEDLEQDSLAMDELQDEYDELTKQLWLILKNIYTSDAVNITDMSVLKQYVYSALNGFSIRTMDLLGLNDDDVAMEDPMADAGATMNSTMAQQMQQTQLQDVNQASQPAMYSRGEGLINFKKAAVYLR